METQCASFGPFPIPVEENGWAERIALHVLLICVTSARVPCGGKMPKWVSSGTILGIRGRWIYL
jgi:hypothetical protein